MRVPASLGISLEAIAGLAVTVVAIIGIVAGVLASDTTGSSHTPEESPSTSQQTPEPSPTPTPTSRNADDHRIIDEFGDADEYIITYPASYTGCSTLVQTVTETDSTVTIRWGYVFYESDTMCSMEMTEVVAEARLKQPLGQRTLDIIFDPEYFYN